jgi:RNA polymerase sigma-70 factor (ECF subfamily)
MANPQSSNFPSTRWSLVKQAETASSEDGFRALGELLERYRRVLVRYLVVARRYPPDRAEDIVQAFVYDKILQGKLIRQANRNRGKFRTFLLTSLNRYAIDFLRRERAARRHPGEAGLLPLDEFEEIIADEGSLKQSFDIEWARQIIARTLEQVREECLQKKRDDIWHVFHARVVLPLLSGEPPQPYESLLGEMRSGSPRKAQNALITGKRMFQRHLNDIVLDYVENELEAECEIADLISICSGT